MPRRKPEKPPSFQFYPKDYLTSPAVLMMTPEQRGFYMELLCHAWLSAEPGVLDESALPILSGTGDGWPFHQEAIGRAFIISGTKWVQERMQKERKAQRKRFRQSQKGGIIRSSGARDSLGRLEKTLEHSWNGSTRPSPPPSSASSSASQNLNQPTKPLPVSPALPSSTPSLAPAMPRTTPSEREDAELAAVRAKAKTEQERLAVWAKANGLETGKGTA